MARDDDAAPPSAVPPPASAASLSSFDAQMAAIVDRHEVVEDAMAQGVAVNKSLHWLRVAVPPLCGQGPRTA